MLFLTLKKARPRHSNLQIMKILLALSLLAVLATGCERESTMIEDTELLDMYDVDLDIGENTAEDGDENTEEDVENPEDEVVTSVGPSEIPADLIPSR